MSWQPFHGADKPPLVQQRLILLSFRYAADQVNPSLHRLLGDMCILLLGRVQNVGKWRRATFPSVKLCRKGSEEIGHRKEPCSQTLSFSHLVSPILFFCLVRLLRSKSASRYGPQLLSHDGTRGVGKAAGTFAQHGCGLTINGLLRHTRRNRW
ncbi:hypothetical protein BJY01DRAFT_126662 [Aspergillus pseudoustus]|uniref:Uncharacterized protein n=1 Tax=Aspergillus pseudoustus TaxID=1810923 RepID=A0ABR4IMV1_9EURO